MFKLNLRLFLVLFVAGNVSSLKCYVSDTSKCPVKNIHAQFYKCVSEHYESHECESPKVCVNAYYQDFPGNIVIVRDCIVKEEADGNCAKIFIRFLGNEVNLNEIRASGCPPCVFDNCNKMGTWDIKDLKGSKNSTAAPLSKNSKKNGSGPSRYRITTTQRMSIFVHIILLYLFSIFFVF